MTQVAVKTETLDERIAEALTTTDRPSTFYGLLKFQVEMAITASDRTAREARAKSIDPQCTDGVAERGRAEDAEFVSQRLRAAVAPLNALYQQAIKKEQADAWNILGDECELKVAQLADELIETYQRAAAQLVDIFLRIADMDAEVDRLSKMPGARHLKKTELVARGVDFNPADSVTKKCQLPELVIGSAATPKILWPPAPVNHTLQYALDVARMMGGSGTMPPTAAEKAAESKRVADFYLAQERGREALNSAAAKRAAGG